MLEFPKANRKLVESFNSNYLKTIIFQVKFPENNSIIGLKESYIKLFSLYPRITDSKKNDFEIAIGKDHTPILHPIVSEKNGFELRSEDGQKILAIHKDGFNLTINGSVYKNFNEVQSELKLFHEALNISHVSVVNRVAIRKINIIDYEIPATIPDTFSVDVMKLLLHPQLLNNMSYFPSQKEIVQSIHNILFSKNDITLNLKYGVLQSDLQSKKGQVIVDIDLFKVSNIQSSEVSKLFEDINTEIFNIFNWAMKPDAIQHLMSKKE